MGIHPSNLTRQIWDLMSPADQDAFTGRFGQVPFAPDPKADPHPPPKSGAAEKKEQASFANWLLLQNSKGRKIPFVWHSTHTRSKATPGTPDFWVGINGHAIWFEFKRDYSCELRPEQEEFRLACHVQQIEHYVVYSAHQAIQTVEKADALDL